MPRGSARTRRQFCHARVQKPRAQDRRNLQPSARGSVRRERAGGAVRRRGGGCQAGWKGRAEVLGGAGGNAGPRPKGGSRSNHFRQIESDAQHGMAQ